MKDRNKLYCLSTAYRNLLLIPPYDKFRLFNQKIYATLRDGIAELSNMTSEEVQNTFEFQAAHIVFYSPMEELDFNTEEKTP